MLVKYDLADCYWFVGVDMTQVFSSARGIYVPVNDAAYIEWMSANQVNSARLIDSESSLYGVLASNGISAGVLIDNAAIDNAPLWAFRAALSAFSGGDQETVYDSWITANKATRINLFFQWNYATTLGRGSNLVGSVANNTGLTVQQMNGIFQDAVKRAENSGVV